MTVAADRVAEALRAGCCDVLNFFETQENAERYLRDHPEVTGTAVSIPVAIEAGRVVFGDVLDEN